MAHSYPIWHEVQACHYKSSKSYGGKINNTETIYVGTSANNSHKHCSIATTRRRILDPKYGECDSFQTKVDGIVLVETVISVKDRVVVKKRTKLKSIKSL
jgi:hypothetical protein